MLTVLCGPMGAGKTDRLLLAVERAVRARQQVAVLAPQVDTRWGGVVRSRSGRVLEGVPVHRLQGTERLRTVLDPTTQFLAVDEAQFFTQARFASQLAALAGAGLDVLVVGLDLDYRGRPFGVMPTLLSVADRIEKLTAICVCCGAEATRTYRLVPVSGQHLVGADESYEARCRACYAQGPHVSAWTPSDPDLSENWSSTAAEQRG